MSEPGVNCSVPATPQQLQHPAKLVLLQAEGNTDSTTQNGMLHILFKVTEKATFCLPCTSRHLGIMFVLNLTPLTLILF